MKEMLLTQGKTVLLDDEIYDKYNHRKFHAAKSKSFSYARNNDLGYMHNLVLGKPVNKKWQVKFKNGNTLDCQRKSLMFIRHSDNAQQKSKIQNRRTKTSKYLGVSHVNHYVARIKIDGKVLNIGKFNTEREAAEAYNTRAKKMFGEKAKLNHFETNTTKEG